MPTTQTDTIALLSESAFSAAGVKVDAEKGLISNVAVMTIGPATGWGFDIDAKTLEQLRAKLSARKTKTRLGHPGMFRDAAGTVVGHTINPRIEGDTLRGDIQLGDYAKSLPSGGNAWDYLLSLAKEDPTAMGLSAAVRMRLVDQPRGRDGQEKPPVLRIEELQAVDFVDDPAANRRGLLSTNTSGRTQGVTEMDEKLKALLVTMGLDANADDDAAQAYFDALTDEQRAECEAKLAAAEAKPKPPKEPTLAAPPPTEPEDNGAQKLIDEANKARLAADHAIAQERARVRELRALAAKVGISDTKLAGWIDDGVSLETAREAALDFIAATHKPVDISVGEDRNLSTIGAAMEDAIALRAGMSVEKPSPRAMEFRGRTLLEMARLHMEAYGVKTAGLSRADLAERAFRRDAYPSSVRDAMLAHSTGDFPYILANTARKRLQSAYTAAEPTWRVWCRRTTVPDFKEMAIDKLSDFPTLAEVPEGDEIKYATVSEAKEVYTLATYAALINFTWQSLVNDDMNAFSRLPQKMALAATRKEEAVVYALLTANSQRGQTMTEDSNYLFDATNHSNLTDSGAAPTLARIGTGAGLMASQTAYGGNDYLNLRPKFLLTVPALDFTAQQLIASSVDPAKSNATINPYQGKITVVSTPLLSSTYTACWYLVADYNEIDTVEVAFLEGQESPQMKEWEGNEVLARTYRVTHNVVARVIDYRGFYMNDGA